ncbi:MAG: inorganic diphosphatase [Armatimonadetes bacterium]|nr:inorganic diphosphatase [Armatimonadota bacterium]
MITPIPLLQIPSGANVPQVVNGIIEIPRGSRSKYEYVPAFNCFKLDRVLYSPMHYPTAYGFVPSTLYVDGDPLDILVLTDEPTFTGCLIEARPIGVMKMTDSGIPDDKIITVAARDQRYQHYASLENMKPHEKVELEHFFSIYKTLEGKSTSIDGWGDIDYAHQVIQESMERYAKVAAGTPRSQVLATPKNHL